MQKQNNHKPTEVILKIKEFAGELNNSLLVILIKKLISRKSSEIKSLAKENPKILTNMQEKRNSFSNINPQKQLFSVKEEVNNNNLGNNNLNLNSSSANSSSAINHKNSSSNNLSVKKISENDKNQANLAINITNNNYSGSISKHKGSISSNNNNPGKQIFQCINNPKTSINSNNSASNNNNNNSNKEGITNNVSLI